MKKHKKRSFVLLEQGITSIEYYRSFSRQTGKKIIRNAKSDYRDELNNAAISSEKKKHLENNIGLDLENKVSINTILSESEEKISDILQIQSPRMYPMLVLLIHLKIPSIALFAVRSQLFNFF